MPKAMREILQNGNSYDETDRMPDNITITNLDIIMYVVAIVGHFVDLGVDINVAVQYSLAGHMMEFGWTLAFILLPAFVNTAVSIRMYAQDKQQDSITNEVTKRHWLRIFILVLQMAPILRFIDALVYALKSRQAEKKHDHASQRHYYKLMLKEDADAALLRIFECFLEAAPQQVLQTSLLFAMPNRFRVHQILSICSSVIGMGWCLAAYQRAVRFAQQDKENMSWTGSILQTLWHFLVTLSRVMSISMIAYLFPYWTILACAIHILIMTTWLQLFDRSPFCSQNKMAELSFSLALGAVYLFTYILPIEGKTRYRYAVYYTVCFIQNVVCAVLWFLYASDVMRDSVIFLPAIILTLVPYVIGILLMVIYYSFFHPKLRRGSKDISVTFKVNGEFSEIS
ncbi:XK-related protein 6 [Leguminivora glycinivorella]|uniref:XK-related protein 6 n=1 Tax=Leguminivora glycinivorella TaxID=1035111 RepID=UPI00200F6ECA|nr:XK-related protein 6 [Leguminivora glycinivorella]